ncbi:hypothetical protein ACFO0N_14900 [Halobium salinum]|uniref:DUF7344 domain-containing protein n=1 Tax=Halobium salinum TaxID=1364940 RepID=A0ABD5PEZ5_9EURY|nr:hypothetical protein [Halobium salinum]
MTRSPIEEGRDEWGELYRMLAESRRRHVLDHLYRRGESVGVGELATQVGKREHASSAASVADDRVRTIHVSLQHVHLPALDNAGLVDWRREAGVVTLGERAHELPLFSPVGGGLVDVSRPAGPKKVDAPSPEITSGADDDCPRPS